MDREHVAPTERIVSAVAERTGRDPLELPPLYDAIEPEALDAVIDDMEHGTVTFPYAGFLVTVNADASVDLVADDPPDSQATEEAADD